MTNKTSGTANEVVSTATSERQPNPKVQAIKKLRLQTKLGLNECKLALEACGYDHDKAFDFLKKKTRTTRDKPTTFGCVGSYVHHDKTRAALVCLASETDFVARMPEFVALANNIAMQVAAVEPEMVDDLMESTYVGDSSVSVKQMIEELIAMCKEHIVVKSFQVVKV